MDAPITPAGMWWKEFCPHGREAQSMAFFKAPGMERLYSGVTNSTASEAAIASLSAVASGRVGGVVVRAVQRQVADGDLGELGLPRRQPDQRPGQGPVDRVGGQAPHEVADLVGPLRLVHAHPLSGDPLPSRAAMRRHDVLYSNTREADRGSCRRRSAEPAAGRVVATPGMVAVNVAGRAPLGYRPAGRRPGHGRPRHSGPVTVPAPGLPLPPDLVTAARREGRTGWLATLPASVARPARAWALRVEAPFAPGGQTAWVAPARDRTGLGRR